MPKTMAVTTNSKRNKDTVCYLVGHRRIRCPRPRPRCWLYNLAGPSPVWPPYKHVPGTILISCIAIRVSRHTLMSMTHSINRTSLSSSYSACIKRFSCSSSVRFIVRSICSSNCARGETIGSHIFGGLDIAAGAVIVSVLF